MKEKLEHFVAILEADSGVDPASADEIMARLRPKFARVGGASLFLQSAQDIRMI